VRINAEGVPEILTKIAKDFVSVSYNINDKVVLYTAKLSVVLCSHVLSWLREKMKNGMIRFNMHF
jgi:hypothetical protein